MDALPIVPALILSFAATYYLGKACLMLFMSSIEQPVRATRKISKPREMPRRGLSSADTIVS